MPHYYAIKKPRGDRKTLAVTKKIVAPDGSISYETLSDPRVQVINSALLSGVHSLEKSIALLKMLVAELRQTENSQQKPIFTQENLALLERYWKHKYEHRRLKDPATIRGDLGRAVAAIGHLPLATAAQVDLQKAVNRRLRGNKQRRVVQRLNEILSWLKRDVRLVKDREDQLDVRYISLEDMRTLSPHLPGEEIRILCWTLFGTGGRRGEVAALTPERTSQDHVLFSVQREKNWNLSDTKTRRHPRAPIIPEAKPWVLKWAALSEETKRSLRNVKASEVLTRICRHVFPGQPSKWITFHNLRDSYVIHLLRSGFSIGQAARSIGDSEATTQKHYGSFVLVDEELLPLIQKLKSK